MHQWGDSWFKQNDKAFNEAIHTLEHRIWKWAKVSVWGKEKYGTYRDEYLQLWDGGLSQIFFGYKAFRESRMENLMYRFDHRLIPIKRAKFGWCRVGFCTLTYMLGIQWLVHRWQKAKINKAFQITCKEYPQFVDELICDVDCYELIKPCKWGNVDGTKIHQKYWTELTADEFLSEMTKTTK